MSEPQETFTIAADVVDVCAAFLAKVARHYGLRQVRHFYRIYADLYSWGVIDRDGKYMSGTVCFSEANGLHDMRTNWS